MIEIAQCPNSKNPLRDGISPEMSDGQLNFLQWLIEDRKPKKILEVGVASGGTSAFLLRASSKGCKVYGVDLNEQFYRDSTKKTGYQIYQACQPEEQKRHFLLTGKDLVESIHDVGKDIDLCLLDTVHMLPGELLQFLAVFPYLSKNAILVLHDLSLNLSSFCPLYYHNPNIATRVLFCSLASRVKLLPDDIRPNIGAIQIDELTEQDIGNIVFALGISWQYWPGDHLLQKYHDFIKQFYNNWCLEIFDECIKRQEANFSSTAKENFKKLHRDLL